VTVPDGSGEDRDPRTYIRIATALHEQICNGALRPGEPTPSITAICRKLGIARQTAAHALHILEQAGLVHRVPGLGYYVLPHTQPDTRALGPGHQPPVPTRPRGKD
jgi:DNA-binding GntR family transcriptional regulator